MNHIITISREFGSGGRTVGKKVAEQLGIPCYDSELIQKIAEESGFAENYVKEAGEYTPGGFLSSALSNRAFGPTNEDEQSPEQRLRDKDKRRAAYHRFYTNMKWGYAQNYHITLDSGELGIDKCADIIADLYKSRA